MESVELQLFEVKKDTNPSSKSESNLVIEEKRPLPIPSRTDIYDKFNNFFSEHNQDHQLITETREILGENAKQLTDDQIQDLTTNVKYLVDSWIEDFERDVFGGKTFNEMFDVKENFEYAK